MLDHQVIRGAAVQRFLHGGKPFTAEALFDGVHDGGLFIQDHIGIVGHAQRHDILALKKVQVMVVDPDIADILRYVVHDVFLLFSIILRFVRKGTKTSEKFYHRSISGARICTCFHRSKVVQLPPIMKEEGSPDFLCKRSC